MLYNSKAAIDMKLLQRYELRGSLDDGFLFQVTFTIHWENLGSWLIDDKPRETIAGWVSISIREN
jgi:hypothetical protein